MAGKPCPGFPSRVRGRSRVWDCGEETSGPSEQEVLAVPWAVSQISITTSLSRDSLKPRSMQDALMVTWPIDKLQFMHGKPA